MTTSSTCCASAASDHSISGRARYSIRPLSAPPMRRPWPPARTTAATRSATGIQVEAVGAVAWARAFPLLDPFGRDIRWGLVAPRLHQQPVAAYFARGEAKAAVIGQPLPHVF